MAGVTHTGQGVAAGGGRDRGLPACGSRARVTTMGTTSITLTTVTMTTTTMAMTAGGRGDGPGEEVS